MSRAKPIRSSNSAACRWTLATYASVSGPRNRTRFTPCLAPRRTGIAAYRCPRVRVILSRASWCFVRRPRRVDPGGERAKGATRMSSAAVPVPGLTALRAPSPRTLSAIAFVGAAIVVATTTLGLLAEEATPQKLLLYEWMSAPYVVAGVIAWWRRPRSRLGPLMIAGGIGTSLAALQFSSPDLLYSFGAALDILPAALFLHVFLAFPDGRLRSTFERTLVVATYVAALGLQIVRMSLGAFDNSFKFRGSPELALAI